MIKGEKMNLEPKFFTRSNSVQVYIRRRIESRFLSVDRMIERQEEINIHAICLFINIRIHRIETADFVMSTLILAFFGSRTICWLVVHFNLCVWVCVESPCSTYAYDGMHQPSLFVYKHFACQICHSMLSRAPYCVVFFSSVRIDGIYQTKKK